MYDKVTSLSNKQTCIYTESHDNFTMNKNINLHLSLHTCSFHYHCNILILNNSVAKDFPFLLNLFKYRSTEAITGRPVK